jgi:purine nucleosidase
LRAIAKKQVASFPSTTKLYRQLLANQPDNSVTFAAIGFMNTLHQLLLSEPDECSEVNGLELIRTKVKQLVVMGGQYPNSESITYYGGAEYNFHRAPASAAYVCENCPTSLVFSGFEVGDKIIACRSLVSHTPEHNPVRKAYELDGFPQGRSAWDETVVFYAVHGPSYQGVRYFEEARGTNIINEQTGANEFREGYGSRFYLKKLLHDEAYAKLFDELQTRPPKFPTF